MPVHAVDMPYDVPMCLNIDMWPAMLCVYPYVFQVEVRGATFLCGSCYGLASSCLHNLCPKVKPSYLKATPCILQYGIGIHTLYIELSAGHSCHLDDYITDI